MDRVPRELRRHRTGLWRRSRESWRPRKPEKASNFSGEKSEIRMTKSETITKSEIRRGHIHSAASSIRASVFGFVSDFGFRISDFLPSFLIAATLILSAASASASEKRLSITAHAALGDSHTLNTKAIQQTIDRCAAAGGGIVLIPEGTF